MHQMHPMCPRCASERRRRRSTHVCSTHVDTRGHGPCLQPHKAAAHERKAAHVPCMLPLMPHAQAQVSGAEDALYHVEEAQLVAHEAIKSSVQDVR